MQLFVATVAFVATLSAAAQAGELRTPHEGETFDGYGTKPPPKVVEEDKDTDYVCCELFNATNKPPADWRTRYPGGVPNRPDTVPADNVTACIKICSELYYPAPDRKTSCGAAAWNGPSKQCYLKTHKSKPMPKKGDVSFVLKAPAV